MHIKLFNTCSTTILAASAKGTAGTRLGISRLIAAHCDACHAKSNSIAIGTARGRVAARNTFDTFKLTRAATIAIRTVQGRLEPGVAPAYCHACHAKSHFTPSKRHALQQSPSARARFIEPRATCHAWFSPHARSATQHHSWHVQNDVFGSNHQGGMAAAWLGAVHTTSPEQSSTQAP